MARRLLNVWTTEKRLRCGLYDIYFGRRKGRFLIHSKGILDIILTLLIGFGFFVANIQLSHRFAARLKEQVVIRQGAGKMTSWVMPKRWALRYGSFQSLIITASGVVFALFGLPVGVQIIVAVAQAAVLLSTWGIFRINSKR